MLGEHGSLTHFVPVVEGRASISGGAIGSVFCRVFHGMCCYEREIFTALCSGSTLYMPEPEAITVPRLLFDWLWREKITVLHMAPAMARLCADLDGLPVLSALRSVFFAGDELHQRDVEIIRRAAPAAPLRASTGRRKPSARLAVMLFVVSVREKTRT